LSNNDVALSHEATLIGLMSGTSLDAVDACCARLGWTAEGRLHATVLGHCDLDIPAELRQRLLNVSAQSTAKISEVSALNFEVGELFAQTVQKLLQQLGLPPEAIDCIGSHGQTIFHQPANPSKNRMGHTLQIGEPSIIAERTGIPVVADFRPRDMAAGGQGAPLVSYADQLLFQDRRLGRCVQNIGGIANVTVLPALERKEGVSFESGPGNLDLSSGCEPIAFDSGPGNMLIDGAMKMLFNKNYDANGEIALVGRVDEEFLDALMRHPFLKLQPPKTTGREQFGHAYLEEIMSQFTRIHKEHVLATLTFYTATTIVDAYERFVFPYYDIHEMILGGGGAYNRTLVGNLRQLLTASAQKRGAEPIKITTHEDYGIDNKAKESLAFAILAWTMVQGLPNNLPSCTGARFPVLMGKIIPGPVSRPFIRFKTS
jgi:anhydro-N-acetylmuramic acid kinase